MPVARLLDLVEDQYRAGLTWREAIGCQLLNLAASATLDQVSTASLAMEPLLYAHFVADIPSRFLEQIALGYELSTDRSVSIPVRTNSRGTICLPGIGRLITAHPDTELMLHRGIGASGFQISQNGRPVDAALYPRAVVARTIEVDLEAHPALEALWPATASREPIVGTLERYVEPLARAFRILDAVIPEFARMIATVTRRIVLMSDRDAHSFAADAAFGAAFFNVVEEQASEFFFVEEIAHQCGHILFSAITYRAEAFLLVPPETRLAEVSAAAHEGRSLYEALHGAFTEATMALCFDACLESGLFEGRGRHEILGRFALILRKMNQDLLLLARPDFYTDRGAEWFDAIRSVFEDLCGRRQAELRNFDLGGQPYAFDYRMFAARNPMAR